MYATDYGSVAREPQRSIPSGDARVVVATYALSSGLGRPQQELEDCKSAVQQRGWTLGREFWDCGPVGTLRLDLGTQWATAVQQAEIGRFRGLVVHDRVSVAPDDSLYRRLVNWAADSRAFVLFLRDREFGQHLIGCRPAVSASGAVA
ncbi:hypothetical protein [Kitasatospora sp. NPDC088548]|uniref:hypothetical protein n=1 Tax=Kitasatospora sp. NPDC088548 TaxID=3364075 RepID=UPI00380DE12D